MSTLSELVDQTVSEIGSYVKNQESVTILTNSLTSSDLTMSIDDATALSKGIVEIDDELIYLKKVIQVNSTAQILGASGAPAGRGWKDSTAAAHSLGAIVRNNPLFPRIQIKRALLDTIKGMNFPCIASETFTFNGSDYSYIMPDSLVDITGISWDVPDSTGVWQLIKGWRLDTNYYDEDTASIKQALILKESPMPGRTVNVQYTKYPTAITDNQDLTLSGLPASCEDVVRLGAMYRLISTIDPGKVATTAVTADIIDTPVAPGQSTNAAKYLLALYTTRLTEEINKQQNNFLNTIQYTR